MDGVIEMRSAWSVEEDRRWYTMMASLKEIGDTAVDRAREVLPQVVKSTCELLYNGNIRPFISAKFFWYCVHRTVWSSSHPSTTHADFAKKWDPENQWDPSKPNQSARYALLGGGELACYQYVDYFFRREDEKAGRDPMPAAEDDEEEEEEDLAARYWPGELHDCCPDWESWPSDEELAATEECLFPKPKDDEEQLFGYCGAFQLPGPMMEDWGQCLGESWAEVESTLVRASALVGGRYIARDGDVDITPVQFRLRLIGMNQKGAWLSSLQMGWDPEYLDPTSTHGQFTLQIAYSCLRDYMLSEGWSTGCPPGAVDDRGVLRVRGLADFIERRMQYMIQQRLSDRVESDRSWTEYTEAEKGVLAVQKASRKHTQRLQDKAAVLGRELARTILDKRLVPADTVKERKQKLLEWVSRGTLTPFVPFHAEALRPARRTWARSDIETLVIDAAMDLKDNLAAWNTLKAWKSIVRGDDGWAELLEHGRDRLALVNKVAIDIVLPAWSKLPNYKIEVDELRKWVKEQEELFGEAEPDHTEKELLSPIKDVEEEDEPHQGEDDSKEELAQETKRPVEDVLETAEAEESSQDDSDDSDAEDLFEDALENIVETMDAVVLRRTAP
ncbi:hypothetical protein PG985_010403 [Apiospora marii]|uniref:Uncharacterized protein n=1 Tax=Apiospora marii TaxID=335849 RepID=A0ABR1S0F0_9PEZI